MDVCMYIIFILYLCCTDIRQGQATVLCTLSYAIDYTLCLCACVCMVRVCACACVCTCVYTCVCVCMHLCVCVCTRVCVDTICE